MPALPSHAPTKILTPVERRIIKPHHWAVIGLLIRLGLLALVLSMSERYARNPKIEEAPLGSDLMLFDPVKSEFYVLNSTMSYLWRRCEGELDMEGIVKSIPENFALADGAPIAADMKAGLDELLALGMITKS
jgi:hypothetical protein